jgi:hypothetical protein
MVAKKKSIIAITSIFFLIITLFMMVPIRSQPANGGYDPWLDLNDDGTIDSTDLGILGAVWGTAGEPINKTALLLELLSRIDTLNATVMELKKARIGMPDYDSDWVTLDPGNNYFDHNLGTTDVLVYITGNHSDPNGGINQQNYGGDYQEGVYYGAFWYKLDETGIFVHRAIDDSAWNQIRIRIWKIPES